VLTVRGRSRVPAAATGPTRAERLALAGAGAIPVSLVGLSTVGWWELRVLALVVLAPASVVVAVIVARRREARRLVVDALVVGVPATLLYDLLRWTFLAAGLVTRDPFPELGEGLGLDPGWASGYAWRYLGNGTGLALAFLGLGGRGVRLGVGYGLLVCGGLVTVLVLSPGGQVQLFPLTSTSLVMAVAGHVIYGLVLGVLSTRLDRPTDEARPAGPQSKETAG
jgi:hypothetical protein